MRFDVGAYLHEHFPTVVESGVDNWQVECPSCNRIDAFYVKVTPPKEGAFICYRCEDVKGKTLVDLVALVEGITTKEAWKRLVRMAKGEEVREGTPETLEAGLGAMLAPETGLPPVDVPLPRGYVACFDEKRAKQWKVPAYLKRRGVTREAIAHFEMGFCAAGRYRGRVILPFSCPNGRSFVARDTTGEAEMKYLSERKDAGHDASRLVYGWSPALEGAEVFIVEGPLDVVRMWQHGLPALSLLGKNINDEKAEMLASARPSGFVVMLDPDERSAPYLVAKQLAAVAADVHIARLEGDPPEGEDKLDPGNSTAEQVRAAYMKAERFRGQRQGLLDALLDEAGARLRD